MLLADEELSARWNCGCAPLDAQPPHHLAVGIGPVPLAMLSTHARHLSGLVVRAV